MSPQDQYITNTDTPGVLAVTGGLKPLIFAGLSTPVASVSGFPGYYDFGAGITFKFTDIANALAYQSMYDNYKIDSVTCQITWMSRGNDRSSTIAGLSPTCYAFADQDDGSTPSNVNAIAGRQGHKEFKFGNMDKTSFTIKVRPKVAALVYNSTISGNIGFQQSNNGWQDCSYPNNEYYSIKLWFKDVLIDAQESSLTGFRITWKYNLVFKGALQAY